MTKFDGIRMADLVEVQDPDKDGGITLVFKEDKFLHVKVVDGKIVTESVPEYLALKRLFKLKNYFLLWKRLNGAWSFFTDFLYSVVSRHFLIFYKVAS